MHRIVRGLAAWRPRVRPGGAQDAAFAHGAGRGFGGHGGGFGGGFHGGGGGLHGAAAGMAVAAGTAAVGTAVVGTAAAGTRLGLGRLGLSLWGYGWDSPYLSVTPIPTATIIRRRRSRFTA